MPFCYQTVCSVQFSSASQRWPCQKPESGGEELECLGGGEQRGEELSTLLGEFRRAPRDATDASFRPSLLIKDSLPEGTRWFAKFTLGNIKEMKEGILKQL